MQNTHVIPMFSALEINTINDYERFRNTKLLIQEKSSRVRDNRKPTPELTALMHGSGYATFEKFRKHRLEWDNLRRNIPLGYTGAIGADLESILHTVHLDRQEFERALIIPLFPRHAVIRLMAGIYQNRGIPSGLPEDEAVKHLLEFSREKGCRCCINYPGLKTIWIEPDGSSRCTFYPPVIKITKKLILIDTDGSDIGTCSIR